MRKPLSAARVSLLMSLLMSLFSWTGFDVASAFAREEGPPPPAAAPAPAKAAPAPSKPNLVIPTVIAPAPLPKAPDAKAADAKAPDAKAADAKPVEPPFTLAQATQGLPGNGALRATMDIEQSGKPLGTLRCDLFADKAPIAVANFVGLARGVRTYRDPATGKQMRRPFYDGNQLHRLIPDFMIQGGDPYCLTDLNCSGRTGSGDPGYALPDEIRDDLRFDRGGRLAMAVRGAPNTAGSQFFITERDTPWLNGSHTIFGDCQPVELIHTLSRLETKGLDVPTVPVIIKRVVITRTGLTAPAPKRP